MLNLVLKVHQYRILNKLRLKKALLVNRAVEKALIAQIPKEVHCVIAHKKVLREGASEVSDLVSE